ncbi:type I-E CRISPR-associated protein Cas5/CasD [Azohydromonas aeria]|uniref:type I-E CRISPR-associated protein Cas5/CasD n=1 Tax=Azohydromonas aeria TaxID=2590212 RepID=UPI0012FA22A7|nr:type I-E CRISPR-associated protein Cas5/CasD [Azohydromonas aeria]
MELLLFQLQAPLASWGEPAVGEFRGTAEYPSLSALLGLLGAALGVRRDDEAGQAALRDGYRFAIGVQSVGELLRDYHTAQVPPRTALKKRPHTTRRDELRVPKPELATILSTRDYRQDAACLVAVQARDGAPHTLAQLADALRQPRWMLWLGRKSCPPAAPLWPRIMESTSLRQAFEQYLTDLEAALRKAMGDHAPPDGEPLPDAPARVQRIAFEDGMDATLQPDLSTVRKDRLIRRRGWQFGDRIEHLVFLETEAP